MTGIDDYDRKILTQLRLNARIVSVRGDGVISGVD